MALCEGNSALHWPATRPEDTTPAGAVAVGHFVQVGQSPAIPGGGTPLVEKQNGKPKPDLVVAPDPCCEIPFPPQESRGVPFWSTTLQPPGRRSRSPRTSVAC